MILRRFVAWSLRAPKTVLFFAAVATAASLFFIQKIQIRSNFSDLLPDDHPAVIQSRRLDAVVGGASFIVVAVETKNQKAATFFLDHFREKISSLEGIRYIDDRPPSKFLKTHSLLYLSLEDLDRLKERILRKIDQAKLQKTRLYIDFEEGDNSFDIADLQGRTSTFLQPHPRYQNREGTLFVSLIKPDWRTTDVSKTQSFIDRLQRILDEMEPKSYDPSLSVRLTGPYVKAMTQKQILLKDAARVSLLSLAGAILYLFFHFRRKRAVFLVGVPLLASVLWSLALAYFLFGSLNLFSSVACAILLGLAADYGIHIYSEYLHHRKNGESAEASLIAALGHLGRTFLTASSTTAAAFFALMFSHFKALFELGMIAGSGILLCALAFVILFPPLTILIERWKPQKIDFSEWTDKRQRFSRQWIRFVCSKKSLVLTSLFLLSPLLTLAFGRLQFDYNLNHIMGRQETKALDRNIDQIFNHSVNPEVVLVDKAADAGPLAAALRRVQRRNEKSRHGTTIKGVVSLPDFVPRRQEEKKEKIRSIKALFTPAVVRHLEGEDRKSYEDLKAMLNPGEIRPDSIPQAILNKFQDRTGETGRILFIFPNFDMTQADQFMRFVEEIREVDCPDCLGPFYASGESTVFYEIVKMLFKEGKYVIGFALLGVLTALFFNFHSLRSTGIVFAPLILGILATLGWMGLTGTKFDIINMAALPIILGTADDYAVHFYQRYVTHPAHSLPDTYRLSFRPILGSAVTTLIGFGSLLIADMGGIRSFGLLCVVGIGLCTVTTLLWFPALLHAVRKEIP